nr:serine/threonine-protein kinase [Peribacillus kribbensis]
MINHSLRNQYKVSPGTVIKGKWYNHEYRIIKELGNGANGIVYLADCHGQDAALKISDNSMSISSEINILKSFAKVRGCTLGPSLLAVDDWAVKDKVFPFYVMEYIKGENYLDFIKKGDSWTAVLILRLLKNLSLLHGMGYIFGDLKPENLIISAPAGDVRFVDVGGITPIGRSIKEFTEFFDRGYWGMGSRKADPAYDLFAAAMIFINSYYPKRFGRKGEGLSELTRAVNEHKELRRYEKVILKALMGKYDTADSMREELLRIISQNSAKGGIPNQGTKEPSLVQSRTARKKKTKGRHLESLILVLLISFIYILYIYSRLL